MIPRIYYSLKEKSIDTIEIGLTWNFKDLGPNVGLNSSMVAFKGEKAKLISKGEEFEGIKHFGDNKTPEGAKDLELMAINFEKIKYDITCVVIIANTFGISKLKLSRCGYLRLFDSETPYCCQLLKNDIESPAYILGVFMKDCDGYWCFQSVLEAIGGNDANESMEIVKNCLKQFFAEDGFSNNAPGIPFKTD